MPALPGTTTVEDHGMEYIHDFEIIGTLNKGNPNLASNWDSFVLSF